MQKYIYNIFFKTVLVTFVLTFIPFFYSCKKIEREPKVETGAVTEITTTSAKAEGNIIDHGNGINHGHCWNVTSNPTISDFKTSLGIITSTGSFTSELQNLQPGTKYNLRAYATNDIETAYGNEIGFTTYKSDAITDADGNYYNIVTIGTQTWMAENLETTKYNDGNNIPNISDNVAWSNLTTPGYCWYNNDDSTYKNLYGALYNWYTVNRGKLCPIGWHVPTDAEWTTLTTYLGGESVAGGRLKETGTMHWVSPNVGAINETGFTALPGSCRDFDEHLVSRFNISIGYNGY
jgi:uncharacterized protein (TIGR02145 family)